MVRHSLRMLAIAALVALAAVPGWGQTGAGSEAYQRGDYARAYRIWKSLAEQGNGSAQYNLGLLYHHGLGRPRQPREAAKWYGRAAGNGDADAQKAVGDLYLQGFWGKKDYAKARAWYRKAAKQGHADARKSLRDIEARLQKGSAVVGTWRSAPILGQLGEMQLTVTFNQDGSFTQKSDFISFRNMRPAMEYLWMMSNGKYAVAGNKITLSYFTTWRVKKMRGEDAVKDPPQPVRGRARRSTAHLQYGKLVMKDAELERIK